MHPSASEMDVTSLSEAGGVRESFSDVLLLKIRKVGQQIFDGSPGGNRLDDHSDSDSHAANAGFATHYFRVDRDAPQFSHVVIVSQLLMGRGKWWARADSNRRLPCWCIEKIPLFYTGNDPAHCA